jgi:carboxyl-terminal processing protease
MNFLTRFRKPFLAVSLAALLFIAFATSPDYFEISKNLDIFNSVYRELNVAYVDGTRPGQLMKTGIDAMLGSLDPYTIYYTENDIEDFRYMTTGEYGGIGATVNDMNGKIVVTDPYEGFAAFKAGIRAGDQIIGVNGNNVEGRRTDEISNLLKGQAGTPVKLKIRKPGQADPVEITLNREEIRNKAVPYYTMIPGTETGYIKLVSFTENCSGEVKEAFMDLKTKGCRNLVLDLRGNLGGLLMEAVNIANIFTDKGQEIVFTRGKISEWDKSYLSVHNPLDREVPLVVLVDENSASASEIVSGALQDLDRAVIVGRRTYGKGLVQQTKDLVYNAKIKVTVAKYYIPSGRCVQALDYSHRDEEGRVEKVPDSLITAFKTKGGRVVYDGAGIMPDVKTPEEKFSNVSVSLLSKFHIFNYATEYRLKKNEIAPVPEFRLTETEYHEFTDYLRGKDYSYKAKSEDQLEELKKNTEEEKYFSDIAREYETLLERIKQSKKDDLSKHANEIRQLLEEEIVGRYYFQKGRIEFSLKNDEDLKEALKLLAQPARIKTILTAVDKPLKPFNPRKKF